MHIWFCCCRLPLSRQQHSPRQAFGYSRPQVEFDLWHQLQYELLCFLRYFHQRISFFFRHLLLDVKTISAATQRASLSVQLQLRWPGKGGSEETKASRSALGRTSGFSKCYSRHRQNCNFAHHCTTWVAPDDSQHSVYCFQLRVFKHGWHSPNLLDRSFHADRTVHTFWNKVQIWSVRSMEFLEWSSSMDWIHNL